MAVAAGTNLLLAPDMYIMTSNLNMLSKGRCHLWFSDADGYACSKAVACVVLKTLSSALANGDHVYSIIRIPWPRRESGDGDAKKIPRRASVNSFGFGGANYHAILESLDQSDLQKQRQTSAKENSVWNGCNDSAPVIIVLSAATVSSLVGLTSRYADYIEKHPEVDL
ncbi:hypothetical protein LZ32DRAFT_656681 [Colletotrichum eremochloae]|nr:hypothetical protein LZ32DRAFT_656681 [Colletotrichum eremochloae]